MGDLCEPLQSCRNLNPAPLQRFWLNRVCGCASNLAGKNLHVLPENFTAGMTELLELYVAVAGLACGIACVHRTSSARAASQKPRRQSTAIAARHVRPELDQASKTVRPRAKPARPPPIHTPEQSSAQFMCRPGRFLRGNQLQALPPLFGQNMTKLQILYVKFGATATAPVASAGAKLPLTSLHTPVLVSCFSRVTRYQHRKRIYEWNNADRRCLC